MTSPTPPTMRAARPAAPLPSGPVQVRSEIGFAVSTQRRIAAVEPKGRLRRIAGGGEGVQEPCEPTASAEGSPSVERGASDSTGGRGFLSARSPTSLHNIERFLAGLW